MSFQNPKTAFDAQRRNPSARPLHFLFLANAEGKNRLLVSSSPIDEQDAEAEVKKKEPAFRLEARKVLRGKARLNAAGVLQLQVKKVPQDFETPFKKCLKEHRIECEEVTLGLDDEGTASPDEGMERQPLTSKAKGEKYDNEQYQKDEHGKVMHGGQFRGDSKVRTRYFDQGQVADSTLYKDAQGRLVDAQGRLVDAPSSEIGYAANAETGTVHQFDPQGRVASEGHTLLDHHTSPLQGQDAAGAGTMKVENGVVRAISSQSGHYTPDGKLLHQFVDRLDQSGVQRRDTRLVDAEGRPILGTASSDYASVMQYVEDVEAGRRERDPRMEEKLRQIRQQGIAPSNRDAQVEYFDPDRLVSREEFEKARQDEASFRSLMLAKFGSERPGIVDPWTFATTYEKMQTWMARMAPQASLGAEQFLQTGGNIDAINRKRDLMGEIGRKVPKVLAEDTADVEAAALFEQLGGMERLRSLAASKGVTAESLESASPRQKLRALRQLLGLPVEEPQPESSGQRPQTARATLHQIGLDNEQLAADFEELGGMARLDELARKRGIDPSRYATMNQAGKATLLIRLLQQAGEPVPSVPSTAPQGGDVPESRAQDPASSPIAHAYGNLQGGGHPPSAEPRIAASYVTGGSSDITPAPTSGSETGNYMNEASPASGPQPTGSYVDYSGGDAPLREPEAPTSGSVTSSYRNEVSPASGPQPTGSYVTDFGSDDAESRGPEVADIGYVTGSDSGEASPARGATPPAPQPDPRKPLDLRQVRKEATKSPEEQQLEQRYYRLGGDEALVEQLTVKWQAEVQALRQQLQSQGKSPQQINELVRESTLAAPANLPRARVARMSLREKYNTLQVRKR